jgi:hypothetical protein
LNELARKMETIHEQVLPFAAEGETDDGSNGASPAPAASSPTHGGQSPSHHRNLRNTAVGQNGQGSAPLAHQSSVWNHDNRTPIMPSDRLANFYRKFNKILLDNVAIAKEKERLALENAQLQDLIAQYISGTRISEDTLAEDNPLFVVNGRANLNFDPPVRRVRPVVQDAVTIQNTNARQNAW